MIQHIANCKPSHEGFNLRYGYIGLFKALIDYNDWNEFKGVDYNKADHDQSASPGE